MEISRELEELLLRRLAETADRNQVIGELSLAAGLHWQEAEAIVDHLIQFHQLELTRRQGPLLVLVAVSLFIGGVILMAWNLLGVYNYLWPYLDPQTPDVLGLYFFYSDLFQTLLFYPQAVPLFLTGLAMLAGSYFGMKEVWASFFDFIEQPRSFSLPPPTRRSRPAADFSENPGSSDFTPSEEALAYLLKRLPEAKSESQLVEELWLKFGVDPDHALGLVRQVLAALGTRLLSRPSVPRILLSLAAVFTGLVWVLQYLFLMSKYLAAHPRPIVNQWQLILRLGDLARGVEQSPVLFGWFALGLVLLAGGLLQMKDLWLSLLLFKQKQPDFFAEETIK
jgi:hypothetical protein